MSDGSSVAESDSRLRRSGLWAVLLAILVAVWLWLAFSSGGYPPRHWQWPGLALGLVTLAVASFTLYPRRPRQLSLAILGLMGCYSVWVALSAVWADSPSRVWPESGRTFTYLTVLALAAVFLTENRVRRLLRYLIMGAGFFLLMACISKLWSTGDLGSLFSSDRLSYPVAYPNHAAALFLVAFWPLVWLAVDTKERAPVRGVALGLASGLLGLAIMTQSRGAVWSLAISAVVMFVVSPARLRTLFYLVVPGLLMVYEFPSLNRYWAQGAEATGGGLAARTLLVASLTGAFIGMILALLERWVKVSRRMKAIFGSVILAGVIAALIYGAIVVTGDSGGPFNWLSETWDRFTHQSAVETTEAEVESRSGTRLTVVGSSGRAEIWRIAWQEFDSFPAIGVGANNFVFEYERLRTEETPKPAHPHSLFLQTLAETGIVGGVLFLASLVLALGALLWPRCTAGWLKARGTWLRRGRPVADRICNPRWGTDPVAYGWEMALLAALAYWLAHGSLEWLWQMPAVTVPAFLFLAAALAEVESRAGVLWPRLSARFRAGTASQDEGLHRRRGRRRQSPLSLGFRISLGVLSIVIIVLAAVPFATSW